MNRMPLPSVAMLGFILGLTFAAFVASLARGESHAAWGYAGACAGWSQALYVRLCIRERR